MRYIIFLFLFSSCSILYRSPPLSGTFMKSTDESFQVQYYGRDSLKFQNMQINRENMDFTNTFIVDWKSNKAIKTFSMDTINFEPFMNLEMLYQNKSELFYFGGNHEIEHMRPENIRVQLANGDIEEQPMKIENKAFRKRKKLNHE